VRGGSSGSLFALVGKAKILAEERENVVLEAFGHGAGIGAMVDLEGVAETVFVENIVLFFLRSNLIRKSLKAASFCRIRRRYEHNFKRELENTIR
jgi:hypothetical protein